MYKPIAVSDFFLLLCCIFQQLVLGSCGRTVAENQSARKWPHLAPSSEAEKERETTLAKKGHFLFQLASCTEVSYESYPGSLSSWSRPTIGEGAGKGGSILGYSLLEIPGQVVVESWSGCSKKLIVV